MSKVLLVGASPPGSNPWSVSTASTSWFLHCSGGFGVDDVSTTNEARFQLKLPNAGFIRNLRVYVASNARTTNTTVKTRINAGTGGQTVTFGSTGVGWQQDSVNSDTINAGDLVNLIVTTGSGSGAFTIGYVQLEYESTSGCNMVYTYNFNQGVNLAAVSAVLFPVEGYARRTIWPNTTDDYRSTRCVVGAAGTIQNLRVYVDTMTMNINPVVTVLKNGVAQTPTLTLTAAGEFIDSTHSFSVAVGDYIQFKVDSTGWTSGNLALAKVQMQFAGSGGIFTMFNSIRSDLAPTNVGFASGTNYTGVGGGRWADTTEAHHATTITFAATLSRIQAGWLNSSGGNETFTLNKNAVATGVTITLASGIAASTSTVDATHSQTYAANDTFSFAAVTGAATSGPYISSVTLNTVSVETGTAAMAFAGISIAGTGSRKEPGTAAMVFAGISISATGLWEDAGSANMVFSGITIKAQGLVPPPPGGGPRHFWTF
jgi:hypothetical protein